MGKERWTSRWGIILAVTGSAVGLGNFLRFPGLAAQYGGGAFMIPYFIALLLVGLPLAWAEWAMGRYGGNRGFNSSPGIYRLICGKRRIGAFIGVIGLLIPLGVYMYYVFIEAWCLGYAWNYLAGGLELAGGREAYRKFFADYIGAGADGALLGGPIHQALVFLVLCVGANFFIVYRGISAGIERFCMWAMPLLLVCAVLVLIRVLTLGTPDPAHPELNVMNGLGFMWNPPATVDGLWKALGNSKMWLDATGQIFFTLGVGFGIVLTYSSYLSSRDDIALSSTTAVAANEFSEVGLGGLITVPAAFAFFGAAGAVGGTFGIGFETLPLVFDRMPMGRAAGFLFFFLLFLAAIASSISMLQPVIAFLEEGFDLDRRKSVCLLGLLTLVGNGIVCFFTADSSALNGMDFWVGTFCIYVLATLQTLLFAWAFGLKQGLDELARGAAIRIPRWFPFVIRFVTPTVLLAILFFWLVQQFGTDLAKYWAPTGGKVAMLFVGFCLLLLGVLVHLAVRRWEAIERKEER